LIFNVLATEIGSTSELALEEATDLQLRYINVHLCLHTHTLITDQFWKTVQ